MSPFTEFTSDFMLFMFPSRVSTCEDNEVISDDTNRFGDVVGLCLVRDDADREATCAGVFD